MTQRLFDQVQKSQAAGRVLGHYVPEGVSGPDLARLSRPANDWTHNQILRSWGKIMQSLLRKSPDGKRYDISGMYLEFDNSGADVNPVPTIDRGDGLEYYTGLGGTADYLRVPISATGEDTTDAEDFPDNNMAIFWAQTAGTVGMNAKPFSSDDDSRVYGGALVAMRDVGDESQDIILSRFYWPPGQQLVKLPNLQISVKWPIAFL